MNATKCDLIGRRIVDVKWNYFDDGRGGKASAPALYLDNGQMLFFSTQETEHGEYGTALCITKRLKTPEGAPKA